MESGVRRMRKGETPKKNCPSKAQGNYVLDSIGVSGMIIMHGMLD